MFIKVSKFTHNQRKNLWTDEQTGTPNLHAYLFFSLGSLVKMDIGKESDLKITRTCQIVKENCCLFDLVDSPIFHIPSLAILCNLDTEKISILPSTIVQALDCVRANLIPNLLV